jgi:hypothetical protein
MYHLQPHQLKDYFTPQQEKIMQSDVTKYFTGKAKPGTHLIIGQYPGKITDYHVGFLCEQPFNPRPFIIMIIVDACCNTGKKSFEKYCEKVLEKADDLPERKAALMMNIEQELATNPKLRAK